MDGLLLVGHGSLRRHSARGMQRVAQALAGLETMPAVETCFLNYGTPTMAETVAQLAGRRITRIVVQPYFLTDGQYVQQDLPAQIAALRLACPDVAFHLCPVLGAHARMPALMRARMAPHRSHVDGIVLVSHGSHWPAALRQVQDIARGMQRAIPDIPVATAFLDINRPDPVTCCQALLQAGCRALAVMPFFLHAGRHVREDLPRMMDEVRQAWQGCRISLLEYLDDIAGLAAIVADHYRGTACK